MSPAHWQIYHRRDLVVPQITRGVEATPDISSRRPAGSIYAVLNNPKLVQQLEAKPAFSAAALLTFIKIAGLIYILVKVSSLGVIRVIVIIWFAAFTCRSVITQPDLYLSDSFGSRFSLEWLKLPVPALHLHVMWPLCILYVHTDINVLGVNLGALIRFLKIMPCCYFYMITWIIQ